MSWNPISSSKVARAIAPRTSGSLSGSTAASSSPARRRRSGEQEAAIDPLTQPEVRAALARASFELLVGFQLSDDQLAYNATR